MVVLALNSEKRWVIWAHRLCDTRLYPYYFVGFSVALYGNYTLLNQHPRSHAAWARVLQDSTSAQRMKQIIPVKERVGREHLWLIQVRVMRPDTNHLFTIPHSSRCRTTISSSISFLVGEDVDWQLWYCSCLFVIESYDKYLTQQNRLRVLHKSINLY